MWGGGEGEEGVLGEGVVGPGGGVVVGWGGVEVRVPEGAVRGEVEVRIEPLWEVEEVGEWRENVTGGAAGYRFYPDGIVFEEPVEVVIPVEEGVGGGGTGVLLR
ncbi:hypothetical protein STHERM_c00600 [Spirochaeta thermophila DSM 6192]|uniref:Uncharacterized protein n=1 Tax=Winmispira thermophila (strain ATCC 49972 / DSM 6192 / RI 19.B1) TaxID=665571 RepID=E0RTY0_WINT6|nr:hypothetical protein STHERM_c00600 [Spirochaeta thermophila DSM 6192]